MCFLDLFHFSRARFFIKIVFVSLQDHELLLVLYVIHITEKFYCFRITNFEGLLDVKIVLLNDLLIHHNDCILLVVYYLSELGFSFDKRFLSFEDYLLLEKSFKVSAGNHVVQKYPDSCHHSILAYSFE